MIPMQTAVRLSILYSDPTRMTDMLTLLSENGGKVQFGVVIYQENKQQPLLAETFPVDHGKRFLQERIDWINEQIGSLDG